MRVRGIHTLGVILFVSAAGAFFFARVIAKSPIDAGLDVTERLGEAPRLAWGTGAGDSVVMNETPHPRAGAVAVRYHALVPRRALGGLRLEPAGVPAPLVKRFYVGSAWPVIFGAGPPGEAAWGTSEKGVWLRDLAALETGRPLPLPAWTALERGGAATVCLLFVLLGLGLCACFYAARGAARLFHQLLRSPYADIPLGPSRPGAFVLFFAVLASVWFFCLACFYPGAMSNDSLGQWAQIQSGHFNDYHPAFHTLTMALIAKAWNSPAAVAAVQIALLAAALAWGLALALRLPVPRAAVGAAFLTAALSPRNANMAVILWKDVWYAAAILLLTILLARLAVDPRWRARPACWAALGAAMALVPLYRHNGLLVLMGLWVVVPLAFWPSRRGALLAVAVSVLVFGGVRAGLYPALNVYLPPRGENVARFCNQRLATLVMQDVPLAPEEAAFLDQVQPLGQSWYTDFSPNDFALAHRNEYRGLLFRLVGRYPLLELDRFRELTDYTWRPWRGERDLALTTYLKIAPNTQGLEQRRLLPGAARAIETLSAALTSARWDWLGWRPAIHLYLALALMVLLWRRWRNPRLLVPFVPVLLNTLSLLLASPSPDYRYQYPMTLALGFLACLGLIRQAGDCKLEVPIDSSLQPKSFLP